MKRRTRVRSRLVLGGLAAVLVVAVGSAGAANPASGTTTTNQELTVEITLSTTNNPVWLGTAVSASGLRRLHDVPVVLAAHQDRDPRLPHCDLLHRGR